MSMTARAPNRLMDLQELEDPYFAGILRRLEDLTAREPISYLHPSKRWEYPWALDRASLAPGSRVLDAGCGASIFPVYLSELGHDVSAVDLHPPAGLNACHGASVDYVGAGITELPFEDESFDAVFCISVIEHLGHDGVLAALRELRRVTRPGGRLMITTDYYEDADARIHYEDAERSFPVDWEFFDEARLHRYLFAAAGLEVEGEVDLRVDWEDLRPRMRRFHGYPYTAVGVTLVRV